MSFKEFITEKSTNEEVLHEGADRVIGLYMGISGNKKNVKKIIDDLNTALAVPYGQWVGFPTGSEGDSYVKLTINGKDGSKGEVDVDPKSIVRDVMKKNEKLTKGGYWYIDGSIKEW